MPSKRFNSATCLIRLIAVICFTSVASATPECVDLFKSSQDLSSEIWNADRYDRLAMAMKGWSNEFSSGKKIDGLLNLPGFDPNYRFPDGISLFQVSASSDRSGHLSARLLRAGLDPFKRFDNGKNALIEIVETKRAGAILLQILGGKGRSGIKLTLPRRVLPQDFVILNADGTALKDTLGFIDEMNTVNLIFETSLLYANMPMVRHFMETYGMRDFLDERSDTSVVVAGGGRVSLSDRKSVLRTAIDSKSVDLIRYLIEVQKFNVNDLIPDDHIRVPREFTPLTYAIFKRAPPQLVEFLLKNGANPNGRDTQVEMQTPIERARYVQRIDGDSSYVGLLEKRDVKESWFAKLWNGTF